MGAGMYGVMRKDNVVCGNRYRLVFRGAAPIGLVDWLDSIEMFETSGSQTLIIARFRDQISLHNVITQIRDWGLMIKD